MVIAKVTVVSLHWHEGSTGSHRLRRVAGLSR